MAVKLDDTTSIYPVGDITLDENWQFSTTAYTSRRKTGLTQCKYRGTGLSTLLAFGDRERYGP